jgi:hypothetical protein
MAEFEVTVDDLNRNKTLTPTWYPFRIKTVEDKPSKAGDSLNTVIDFVGVGDGPAKGVELREYFSHKIMPGVILPLVTAVAGGSLKPGKVVANQETLGDQVIEIYVTNEDYGGRRRNRAADYRPLRKTEAAT